ncbi:formate dehydrogenase subunit alpha [Paraburkholderia kururiensis]|uniref:Formate dehydrogenase subunit alpha n=1 Tax=Paraburkholderia kururiensis TaxID=984307 RepID=A0ABZ0WSY2_9BURK|nr:formate dehydrogenase subunit alpha [Paraburkholderia kururiensis]WQD80519.1 formate dehydrogenase subunit alpha [Paraburkholderia kururiensis]
MEDDTLCTLLFDGRPVSGPRNTPLIDFLAAQGITLPHVCYHPSLGAIQTCDVCWVEVNGKLVRGCTLRSAEGLVVTSAGATAREAQHEGLDRLLAKHELYCSVCEHNTGDCTLHNTVADLNPPIQRYAFQRKPYDKDQTNPFYTYDPDQCILCGRCVEACQNVEVNETLSIDFSMEHPRVLWDGGKAIGESSCVSCGHCVTVCPCNALLERTMQPDAGPFTSMPQSIKRPLIDIVKTLENTIGAPPVTALSSMDVHWRQPEIKRTKTVCTYCGVGCSFEMWTRDRQLLKVQPVAEAPANGISTCIKGRFAWDFINDPQRLTTPLVRENGRFREASWDEALGVVAQRLLQIRAEHGPDAIGFIGSSKASNEEAYLTQKIARLIIGTNSVDNSSRYCQNPATMGLFRTVGYGGDAGTIKDIESAELVVIVGSNTAENHPVIASRIKAAKKHHGQKLIVVDTRRNEMAERADLHLRPKAGTDLVWASALSRYMFDHGLADLDFLKARVNRVDEYRASLEPFTLEFAAEVTGLPREELVQAAEMIGRARSVCLLWAMGITQHSHGADTSTALSNLLLVTGNYGRPGTGGYPMRGHNNVQGASDFGCLKNVYPGYEKVTDPQVRERWAKAWGVAPEQLSDKVGEDNFMMVEEAAQHKLKAMYVIGEETAFSDADSSNVHKAFTDLEFLVVQDIFLSRTAEFADVVLPGCPSVEKDGTFVNTERRIQRFYEVMPPLGNSRPDWRILTDLAARMGHDWGYTHPSQIMDEVAGIAKLFKGVSYARLEGFGSLLWPMNEDGSDTPLLYTERFHTSDGKATLYPLKWQPPAEAPDAEYDLIADNGRMLEQFQSNNQTGRGERVIAEAPQWFVEVSRELAAERGIESGAWVKLTSRRGSAELQALVTDRVTGHTLFVPIHQGKPGMNGMTGEHHDPDVNTPAYKEVAVKLELLPKEKGRTPLPPENYRNATRTPNDGVDATRKWSRSDYVEPPARAPHPERF